MSEEKELLKFELNKRTKKIDNFLVNPDLTILDYFIAHAPAEPQWVFDVPMKTERPTEKFVSEDPRFGIKKELIDRIHEWEIKYAIKEAQMWPAEWARVQLIERSKFYFINQ